MSAAWANAPLALKAAAGLLVAQGVLFPVLIGRAAADRAEAAAGFVAAVVVGSLVVTLLYLGLAWWLLRGRAVAWLVAFVLGVGGVLRLFTVSDPVELLDAAISAATLAALCAPTAFRACFRNSR